MNTHPQHPSKNSVGRHPDRPARVLARSSEEPSDTQAGGFSSVLRSYPIVLGITVLTVLLLVTVAALILCSSSDPTPWIMPVSAAILGISSLIGGITAGKLNPARPMAASLICGGLATVLLILISLFFQGKGDFLSWSLRIGAMPLHLLGGVLTRPKAKAPTHTAGK